jgi:hypothetical protein
VSIIYVAKSKTLQEWGSDVGISKSIYKVGLFDGKAADAIADLNARSYLGQTDWALVSKQDTELTDEAAMIEKMAQRGNRVDPTYYPKIKGDRGIFKVNLQNVEAQLVVRNAMAGADQVKVPKLKPSDIGDYLIEAALR